MSTDSFNVSFQSSGRYSVLGPLNSTTKSILFVLHGQGQLANYFIRKFSTLQSLEITVIAPEGLHNYYLEGYTGRVGAGWMTSENRLSAIENHINFLNATLHQVKTQVPNDVNISVLGFSQGTATASRWIAQSTFSFKNLILWGGALPPDLNKKDMYKKMQHKKLLQVIGNKDQYIDSKKIEELTLLADNYGIANKLIMFEGGHDIDSSVLKELFVID